MGRAGAAVGSAVFFALAPGVVAGVVPWWLTGWEATDLPWWWLPLRVAGVVLLVAGAGVLGRLVLVPYAAVVAAAFVTFVRWYEEPTLAWQFGDRYQAYRAAVPGWWPRRH